MPKSGPVSWAPLFARYGDDALRFQLIFDLCEDLRVDCARPAAGAELPAAAACDRALARGCVRPRRGRTTISRWRWSSRRACECRAGRPSTPDARLRARCSQPRATVADSLRIANEIYDERRLPPVTDLEAFHARVSAGARPQYDRGSRTRRQQDQQQQQTQSGAEGEQKPAGERRRSRNESPQNAESGDQRDGGRKQEIAGYGDTSGGSSTRRRTLGGRSGRTAGRATRACRTRNGTIAKSRYKRNWSWVQEKQLAESNIAEDEPPDEPVLARR